jgi:hypothetical protein
VAIRTAICTIVIFVGFEGIVFSIFEKPDPHITWRQWHRIVYPHHPTTTTRWPDFP